MSLVTFIWSMVIGACATMALPHLLIGIKGKTWENLFFAIAALSVAGIACGELPSCTRGQRRRSVVRYNGPTYPYSFSSSRLSDSSALTSGRGDSGLASQDVWR